MGWGVAVGRAAEAIRRARLWCPDYAARLTPLPTSRMHQLCRAAGLVVSVRDMEVPTLLLPGELGGRCRLLVSERIHRPTRDGYLLRHELGHILSGDADGLTAFSFQYPLPEAEMVADLFAFADLISEADLELGPEWVEERIRSQVVLEHTAWYLRVERIAPLLPRLLEALGHRLRERPPEWLGRRATRRSSR